MAKLLSENGATISAGEVGAFACTAVEKNSIYMLKDIIKYGGDVTLPSTNGSTALHTAVSEGNTDMVKFLLDQGADIDKPDLHGWTPRALADHQGHDEIKDMFQNTTSSSQTKKKKKSPTTFEIPTSSKLQGELLMPSSSSASAATTSTTVTPAKQGGGGGFTPLARHSSEPAMPPPGKYPSGGPSMLPFMQELPTVSEINWLDSRRRRKPSNFQNSIFGVMQSAADTGTSVITYLTDSAELNSVNLN